MLISIHVAAGGLAVLLGGVALFAKKGGTVHRRSGLLFVSAMLVMGISASMLGLLKSPTDGNVLVGFMTAYLVGTALLTVRPVSSWTRGLNWAALMVAVGLALIDFTAGMKAVNSARGFLNGVPFQIFFFFGAVMTAAAMGDVRVMRSGAPRGAARLSRHLWRMCFALFVAAGSFFSIRARVEKVLPYPFTTPAMRALPILLVFGAMFYWLWRLRRRRPAPVVLRHEPMPLATGGGA